MDMVAEGCQQRLDEGFGMHEKPRFSAVYISTLLPLQPPSAASSCSEYVGSYCNDNLSRLFELSDLMVVIDRAEHANEAQLEEAVFASGGCAGLFR